MAADHLLQHLRHRAGAVLDVARDAAQAAAEVADHDADDRHDDERQQREPPVEPHEVAEAHGDRQRRADRVGDRAGRGRRELVRVERDLRLDRRRPRACRSTASAAAAACRSGRAAGRTRRDSPVQPMPYSEMYAPTPRSRNTPTIVERQPLRAEPDRAYSKLRTIGMTSHASMRSPAATIIMPTTASAERPPVRPDVAEEAGIEGDARHRVGWRSRRAAQRRAARARQRGMRTAETSPSISAAPPARRRRERCARAVIAAGSSALVERGRGARPSRPA